MLLNEYEKFDCFFLAPAVQQKDGFDFFRDLTILKRPLVVRPAWQIGEHDPDFVALAPDDDPIIPPDVIDAPVLSALKRMRDRKK